MSALDGPTRGERIQLMVERAGQPAGYVETCLSPDGGEAEVGYVVHPEHRGSGLAGEATGLLVDRLIADHGVHRLHASLSPANIASMRVLESVGMRFESLASLAWRRDGVWEDDLRYSMTAGDRAEWIARPTAAPSDVSLTEITPADVHDWAALTVHHSQRRFVSSVYRSYADALFPQSYQGVETVPWIRGITADGERVGFTMVSLTNGTDGGWFLWRLLVDRRHQRRGIGERAVALVADDARHRGVDRLFVSFVEERGGPARFYDHLGFERTGAIVDGEVEAVLHL